VPFEAEKGKKIEKKPKFRSQKNGNSHFQKSGQLLETRTNVYREFSAVFQLVRLTEISITSTTLHHMFTSAFSRGGAHSQSIPRKCKLFGFENTSLTQNRVFLHKLTFLLVKVDFFPSAKSIFFSPKNWLTFPFPKLSVFLLSPQRRLFHLSNRVFLPKIDFLSLENRRFNAFLRVLQKVNFVRTKQTTILRKVP